MVWIPGWQWRYVFPNGFDQHFPICAHGVVPLCLSDRRWLPTGFLQRPFAGNRESQPKGDGIGKFVASQHVKIWTLSNFKEDLRIPDFHVWCRGMSLKKSQANKMASYLIYCIVEWLGGTLSTTSALPIPPFFLSSSNIGKCTKVYRDCGPKAITPVVRSDCHSYFRLNWSWWW